MWKSPVYKFRIPENEEDGENGKLKELVIDVTGSAPPFTEPSDALKSVLNEVFHDNSLKKIDNVLEFGAAKLKNIPFVLKAGKAVCAVEFKELAENSFTKKNIKKCKKFGNKFQELLFPNPFIQDTKKFDLALLINVIPVMPVPAERMYLLDILYDKIENGKYLLWVAQKEGSYREIREKGKNVCGDGIWMGKNRYMKTFYRYYPVDELDEIMALYGFKLIKRFDVGDDARLYEKSSNPLFRGFISAKQIRDLIPSDDTIEKPKDKEKLNIVKKSSSAGIVAPNPKQISVEEIYIEKLKSIKPGINEAEDYHRTISHAVSRIFRKSLRNMDLKTEIDNGIKIIDTLFTNSAKEGFFSNLKTQIECTHPIVEAKNITGDPGNTEFDQLNGRLNAYRSKFGILICRNIQDSARAIKICKTYLPDRYVIFLTDEDIVTLLKLYREKKHDEIDDYMDNRLKEILF